MSELYIPISLRPGLARYVKERIPTGDFLRAVLENNLRETCARADPVNRALLPEIVEWVGANVPEEAWGSPEKVAAWLNKTQTD